MEAEKFSITSLLEPFKTSPVEAFHAVQLGEDPTALTSIFVWGTVCFGAAVLAYALIGLSWTEIRCRWILKPFSGPSAPASLSLSDITGTKNLFLLSWARALVEEQLTSESPAFLRRTIDSAEIINDRTVAPFLLHSRLIAATPGLLTALGVLGAFVGLQLGLRGLNLGSGEIEKSIPYLVSSLSVKFSASIWGILASLLFNLAEKAIACLAHSRIHRVQRRLDDLIPRYSPERSLSKLHLSSVESLSWLRGLSAAIGGHMQEALANVGQLTSTAIKEAMEPAVATFVESVRKTNEDFRTGSSEGLSDAIANSAERLQESLERVGDRYNQQFIDLSRRLTESFESLHGPVARLSDSLQKQDTVLGQAVERLNANAGLTDTLSAAAGTLSSAAKQLVELKQSWELSASRNESAATAQDRAAKTNEVVSNRFAETLAHIEKFQGGMDDAAKVVQAMGMPMRDLHEVLGNLPGIVREIEGVRKSGDSERDSSIRQMTGDLALTVSRAVEQLAGYAAVAQSLETAAEKMSRATQSLESFSSNIESGAASHQRAAVAAEDAAKFNARAASALEGLPDRIEGMSSSLSATARSLTDGTRAISKSFELEADQQRRFLQELGDALGEYMDGIRGKTLERINEFGEHTSGVISKLEALQNELNSGVETVQEVGTQLLNKGRK